MCLWLHAVPLFVAFDPSVFIYARVLVVRRRSGFRVLLAFGVASPDFAPSRFVVCGLFIDHGFPDDPILCGNVDFSLTGQISP
jgi:hypothetical protein